MRYGWVFLLILVLPAGLSAQRGRGAAAAGRGAQMGRIALERQIVQRFVEQSSRELGLGTAQRNRLEEILRRGTEQRRELAERGVGLRQQLTEAIRDPETSDARLGEILDAIDKLREDEHGVWRADQDAIREMFTPRQRAVYTARWLRLQEVIRDVMNQRPPGPPGMPRDTFPPLGAVLPPVPGTPSQAGGPLA